MSDKSIRHCYFRYNVLITLQLSIQDRARIAVHMEAWNSIIRVQRWWRRENSQHAALDAKSNKHNKKTTTAAIKKTFSEDYSEMY